MAMKRGIRYTLIGAAVVAVLLVGLFVVLTRTDFGVERAGRFALDRIRSSINGELTVDRVASGGLLSGVTLHGVALNGPDGRPFVRADSARLAYRFRTLLGGSLVFDRLILHSPEIVIERLPGDDAWNYERLFPSDSSAADTASTAGLVLIEDATIRDGRVVVRLPWEPDGPIEPGDTARLILEAVPGGTARTLRFQDVNGRLPRIVWEAPEEETQLIQIGELSARAFIWDTPLDIRELEGVVTIRDSVIHFDLPRARLPGSHLSLLGEVVLGEEGNRYDIQVDASSISFADLQWLYPPLPADGGGSFQFRMQTQSPGSTLWLARNARVQASGSELAGSFGVITGDTVYFTNVELEASPLDLELLQRLVPSVLPLEGLLIGTVEVEGPISMLRTRGDVRYRTFRDGEGAESEVRWDGTVGGRPPYHARGLTARIRDLDLEQVAQFAPGLRLRGKATGTLRATGSLEEGLQVTGDLALDRDGRRSGVTGSGRFAVAGDRSRFDFRFDAEPVGLELLTEQFPGLGRLAGEARGPVTVTGTLDDLQVDADIMTPAGAVVVRGTVALDGAVPRYRAQGSVTDFALDRVAADLPETRVTARFEVDGQGDTPETVEGRAAVEVLSARVAGVEVRASSARGRVADGLLRLDSLYLATEVGSVVASGSLGLREGRSGELVVRVRADRLSRLEPVVFPDAESVVHLSAYAEPTLRLAGTVDADAVVTGSVQDWAVRGRADATDLVYDRLRLATARSEFQGRIDTLAVEATVDSVFIDHRRFPHARASVAWSPGGGRLVARARGLDRQQLDIAGSFQRAGRELDFRLRQLELTTRGGRWAVADTVVARVGMDGLRVDSLVLLRSPQAARILVNGSLPWHRAGQGRSDEADLRVALDSVRIGEILRVAQVDSTMDGVVSGRFQARGTALAPVWVGTVEARPFRYQGAVLDSAAGEIRYEANRLQTRFSGWQGAEEIISGFGTLPVDLALADRRERWLEEPLDVQVTVDSVPAGLVSFLAPGFEELSGIVDGRFAVVGTPREVGLEGELRLLEGSAYFRPLNVTYHAMEATARMGAGRVVEIDARFGTGTGRGHVLGTLDVTRPRDPAFDLAITARELDASRRRDVVAVATGRARVAGRYTRPIISGDVRIIRGELNLDEIWRQYQIVQLDPSLFQMFDSTEVRFRPPPEIPFLRNLVLTDVTLEAERDFWLRSRELNVEVAGELDMEMDRQAEDLRLTGTLQAVDGNYALQLAQGVPGRTFDIRSGSIEFIGTPGIDPGLDIQAAYRVRRSQGDPIDVLAEVTGSLKDPRVHLTSDSDLPLSESDLASYILFGRSGAELTQAETDVVSSGIGLVRPVVTGSVSSLAQQFIAGTGIPIDYIALTTPEYGLEDFGAYYEEHGVMGVLHNTQLEVGIDAGRDLSLVGSLRVRTSGTAPVDGLAGRMSAGARVEWRFRPTWTTELYVEDRFARTPSFGFTEIDDRKVWGLSLYRDWGY